MKVVVSLFVLLCSISSFAGASSVQIMFKKNSGVPSDLQTMISEKIASQCSMVAKKGWRVWEENTLRYANPEDTLSPSMHYRTLLIIEEMDNDGMHPMGLHKVAVESVTRNIYTPGEYVHEVLSIVGNYCK